MKPLFVRSRIALMAFALGLAAVYLWNGLSIGSGEVAVNLPTVNSSEDVLVVFPAGKENVYPFSYTVQEKKAIGARNLSLYDIGEFAEECVTDAEYKDCMAKRQAAKQFIYDHLASQRRGYVEIALRCIDCAPVYHVFIEPDWNGRWGYVITLATDGPSRTETGHNVQFRRPNSEEKASGNYNKILSFIDDKGKEVESF